MHIFLFICFQHLNFVLFHLLESTITLHLQHFFLSVIEQTKKRTEKCPLHKFLTFFPFIYDVNMLFFLLFATMKKTTFSIEIPLQKKSAFLYSILFEHVKLLMALFSLFLALRQQTWTCNT